MTTDRDGRGGSDVPDRPGSADDAASRAADGSGDDAAGRAADGSGDDAPDRDTAGGDPTDPRADADGDDESAVRDDGATDGDDPTDLPADRASPVGAAVVRGDAAVTGDRAAEAVAFDPADDGSVARAAETVAAFADADAEAADSVYVLRGAAACAALVLGEGSYKDAAARAGTTVGFIRKWARVHDLPESIRRHVAAGDVPPTAAKHVARLSGRDRYLLAWAVLDAGLTVREVRTVASEAGETGDLEAALRDAGVDPGTLRLSLPSDVYLALRRRASLEGTDPGAVVAAALRTHLDEE